MFAHTEVIVIRVMTINWEIHEFVVKFSVFKHSLTATHIAQNILNTIQEASQLDIRNWVATHQDWCNVNKRSLSRNKDELQDADHAENWCCSHTLCNGGKERTEVHNAAFFFELFRKMWQQVIQFPYKARDLAKEVFEEQVKDSGGVRFFLEI